MAAVCVTNQNVDTVIAVEVSGHLFAARTEPWLGQAVSLDCLRICILAPCQANIWIILQGVDENNFFTNIRQDEVQGI